MTFIDWFAGIGGFRRGMELAGHKCVGFCENDRFAVMSYTAMHLLTDAQVEALRARPKLRDRQKEVMKDEYRHGEWYAGDIRAVEADDVPRVDVWCFGAPCQDFSMAGRRRGLDGDNSPLVREVFRLLGDTRREDRPGWLIYENVKGLLTSKRGWDFAAILCDMEDLGYDVEWHCFNARYCGVPQNRERVYVVGRARGRGLRPIFPIPTTAREACADEAGLRQILQRNRPGRDNLNQYRVYDATGISPTTTSTTGGGKLPHVAFALDYSENGSERTVASAITTRNTTCGVNRRKNDGIVLAEPLGGVYCNASGSFQKGILEGGGADAQNAQGVPAVWYEPWGCYISVRRLTPRECFRLQGWSDDHYDRAALVNSDTQLYKQAGNGVTVNVAEIVGGELKRQEEES